MDIYGLIQGCTHYLSLTYYTETQELDSAQHNVVGRQDATPGSVLQHNRLVGLLNFGQSQLLGLLGLMPVRDLQYLERLHPLHLPTNLGSYP